MADKAIGVNLEDRDIVQGIRTGNSPWSPIAIAQVPVKEPPPSAPVIDSVTAPEASAGVLEIKVGLPETNADGTALARAELVRLRLHHSTSPGVTESDPCVDFPPSETLLWAPNDTATHYVRVRVQDSHGLWSELSNEAFGQAKSARTPQEDSGLWAHRLGVESIFTNDSPEPGYVSWSNVVLYWRDNKYEIADGSTNKKYIWWDYSVSTTTFQTSDTRPELDLEDVIIGYNDNGTWRLMCYQPTVMADYVRAGVLQSSNWGATTGSQLDLDNGTLKLGGSDSPKFQVDADGVLHATGAVIEGALTAGEGSSIDGAYIEDATITDAKIANLTFSKITAGTNTASLTIDSGGYIQSENYSAGSSGFRISGSGDAEFNDVTVRGALITGSGSQIDGSYITAGTITGRTIQTSASNPRAVLWAAGSLAHRFTLYDSAGNQKVEISESGITMEDQNGVSTLILNANTGEITCNGILKGAFFYSGAQVFGGAAPTSWTTLDLSGWVGYTRALVLLRIHNAGDSDTNYRFRPDGSGWFTLTSADLYPSLMNTRVKPGYDGYCWVMTSIYGRIEWDSDLGSSTQLYLEAYIRS